MHRPLFQTQKKIGVSSKNNFRFPHAFLSTYLFSLIFLVFCGPHFKHLDWNGRLGWRRYDANETFCAFPGGSGFVFLHEIALRMWEWRPGCKFGCSALGGGGGILASLYGMLNELRFS